MNSISGIGSLVSAMRSLENSQPSPSIADVAGSPETPGPSAPAASDFTSTYQMQVLANALRANADMALSLIQMVDKRSSQE
jgi:hypothetical protein